MMNTYIEPIDPNNVDGAFGKSAKPLEIPELSARAQYGLDFLGDTIGLFEYLGQMIATDESGYLTETGLAPGDNRPIGGPRGVFHSAKEVNNWLELVADDADEYYSENPDELK